MKCDACGKDYSEMPYRPALYGDMDKCLNKEHWNAWNAHDARSKAIAVEVNRIISLLEHPAGFDLGQGGMLCVRGIDECSPPKRWEVDWNEWDESNKTPPPACPYFHSQEFECLDDAVKFFVERRHEMKLGLDLEKE